MPEWAAFYINYKGLKKLIKVAAEAADKGEPVVLDGERHHQVLLFLVLGTDLTWAFRFLRVLGPES